MGSTVGGLFVLLMRGFLSLQGPPLCFFPVLPLRYPLSIDAFDASDLVLNEFSLMVRKGRDLPATIWYRQQSSWHAPPFQEPK